MGAFTNQVIVVTGASEGIDVLVNNAGGTMWTRLNVESIAQRERMLVTFARGKSARWLKQLSPGSSDRMAAAAIRDKR